jgi:V/A-type H+-transporting ATPase subunit K
MIELSIVVLVGLLPMVPAVIFFLRQRKQEPAHAARGLMLGLNGFNVIVGLMALGIGIVWMASPPTVMALSETTQQVASSSDSFVSLGAAISTGLAAIGAGIAVSAVGAAAVGAIAEKPDVFGRALIFVGLAEGIAIYGLIISFMILNQ